MQKLNKLILAYAVLVALSIGVAGQTATAAKRPDALQRDLRSHVEYLASPALEGRRAGEPGATTAAGYIANIFAKLRLKPGVVSANGKPGYLQPFTIGGSGGDTKKAEAYNVIGILEGNDKTRKNEAVIVAAHYDHLGRGGEKSLVPDSTEVHHGADDNASGVAAMLEIARILAKEKKNDRTIIFIAFSGEESGLFGSKFYVGAPVFPLEKTVAMLNLDMVGRLKDGKLTIGGIGSAAEWKALVEAKNPMVVGHSAAFGGAMSVTRAFDLQLNLDGFGPSDHASFYMKKVPVLFFFTGTHLDYHKPSDTAEKINYEGLASISEYVADLVRSIADNRSRPTYTDAPSTPQPADRARFNVSLGTIPSYTESADGMIIDGVRDNSPAARAGLKAGDKIISLAGKPVLNVRDYTDVLGEMKAEVEYEMVVMRGAEKLTFKIVPVKR